MNVQRQRVGTWGDLRLPVCDRHRRGYLTSQLNDKTHHEDCLTVTLYLDKFKYPKSLDL